MVWGAVCSTDSPAGGHAGLQGASCGLRIKNRWFGYLYLKFVFKTFKMKTRLIFLLTFGVILFSIATGQSSKKKIAISGYVTDGTNASIENAVVMIDGQKSDVITDSKGYYKVKVNQGSGKLGIFTYTNGIKEELINGRTRINFQFEGSVPSQISNKPDPDDEAINIGYGKVRKRDMTTTVNKIDGTKPKYSSYQNIYDMIRGEVPGVQVNGTSITIQGPSSIMLSSEPSFVVDGITVSTISDIRPSLVKSIEILKGSAAAIYGSRGANGVILINLIGAGDR